MGVSYTVYRHTTPNGKVYIGITSLSVKTRWKNGQGYNNNPRFYNAIKKYGWANIKHEIIAEGLTKEEACALEIKLIEEHNSTDRNHGYNVSRGGDIWEEGRGKHLDEERKRKIGEAVRKRWADESRNAAYKAERKKVLCVEEGIVYESITKAAEAHGVRMSAISRICNHTRPPLFHRYTFEFV